MTQQNKTYLLGLIGLVVLVGLIFWQVNSRSGSGDTIKIGADYAISGNLSQYGEWATSGITLAVEEINESGGINSRPVEVIYEDSEGQPSKAVSAYQKLRNVDGVRYIITYQSSIALAVAPLANQDRVIQMDVSATTPDYSSPNDYTFRTGVVATQLAEDAADILHNDRGVRRVGILFINNDFGQGMIKVFRQAFLGQIVAEEKFEQDSTDFRTQLSKLKAANPETIFLVSHIKEGGLILKQAEELSLATPFFSDVYSVEGPDFLAGARDAANGVVYIAPKFRESNTTEEMISFAVRYRSRFGTEPTYFAAQSYDGMMSLYRALLDCSYEDTGCAKQALFELDYEGASGPIKFDENGDVVKPVELKTIEDGQFVRL